MSLTPKQLRTLDFIREYIRAHRVAPTLAEIAESEGVGRVTILDRLRQLEARGYIRRQKFTTRSIEVLETPQVPGACPACGRSGK